MSDSKNLIANKAKHIIGMLDDQEQKIIEAHIADRIEQATWLKKLLGSYIKNAFITIAVVFSITIIGLFIQECDANINASLAEKAAECQREVAEYKKALELIINTEQNSE